VQRVLSDLAMRILRPVCKKNGLSHAGLLMVWDDLVGPAYSGRTLPLRLQYKRGSSGSGSQGAVLHIKIEPSHALQFHYDWPNIQSRINQYMGYYAIGSFRLEQGPVSCFLHQDASAKHPLSEEDKSYLNRLTASCETKDLADALQKLGQGILER
jgi:hypothetical protein